MKHILIIDDDIRIGDMPEEVRQQVLREIENCAPTRAP